MNRKACCALVVALTASFTLVGCNSKPSAAPGGSAPGVRQSESPDRGSQSGETYRKESTGSGSR